MGHGTGEPLVYAIEPRITVRVEFGRCARCADVTIPWHLLRFLDRHAERRFTADGVVVYRFARTAGAEHAALAGPFSHRPGYA